MVNQITQLLSSTSPIAKPLLYWKEKEKDIPASGISADIANTIDWMIEPFVHFTVH